MTAHIKVVSIALAVAAGIVLTPHRHPKATFTTGYTRQVGCTFTWTGQDAVVFTNAPCDPTPEGFTKAVGYAPPTGVPDFGVACAVRNGDTFEVIANRGGNTDAGLLCEGILAQGWLEDPVLGSEFNTDLQEGTDAVRA